MTDKIKVLHILSSFGTGGMEAHLLNFFNHTDFTRYEHHVFVGSDAGQLREEFHKLPLKIKTLKCTPRRYFYSLPYGIYFCLKNGIGILHGHNYWSYLYCYFLSLLTSIPFITGDYGLGTWKRRSHHAWESKIFKRAVANVAVSKAILEKDLSLVNNDQAYEHKFKLIYPVIKSISRDDLRIDEKKAIKEKLGIDNDNPVLTVIGRIIKLKGHRFAIEAVKRINREESRVNLLIVGRLDDPDVLDEEDIGKQYIIFKNYYEHIEDIWTVTDIFLIPSISEGTPLVLLEYFALGKSVIASNISGNKELIRHGWNGYLFKNGDVDDLTEKIDYAITCDEIKTVQNNASRYYEENLTPALQTRQVESIYTEFAL
jgi:glycosyltransferase involved in cell wall biosynthesis